MNGKNIYTTTYRWEVKDENNALIAFNIQEGLPNTLFEMIRYFSMFLNGKTSKTKYHLEIHERN